MKDNNKFSISKLGEWICVVVLLVMTFLTFINVCSRYILHSSIAASEEITTNLFVILSLVGAALALQSRNHIGLNIFVDMLKPKAQLVFRIFEGVAGMFFMGFLSYYGFERLMQQISTGMISPGLGVPAWLYGSFCLLGFVIMFVAFTEVAVKACLALVGKKSSEEEA